ncbi:MAG: glycosyltransferase family 2 protein [Limisphaerales bacterium]
MAFPPLEKKVERHRREFPPRGHYRLTYSRANEYSSAFRSGAETQLSGRGGIISPGRIKLAGCRHCLSFRVPMHRPDQIAVVSPCLNEGPTIGPLIREIRAYLPHIIVVNDGSTDATAHEALKSGATVISHARSRGKGASLRAGFAFALQQGFSVAIALDGDGQHAPADIPGFLHAAQGSTAALLVGNRMHNTRPMPWIRRVVNSLMSRILSNFCDTHIPDSQCGFRMIDLHAWNRLQFSCDHFEIESEMIVRFLHAGFTIDFIPVQTRYGSPAHRRSKIRPLADTLRWLRWWIAIRHELSADALISAQPRYEATPQDAAA